MFSFALDGGDLREHARGLRQPFGIAFRSGDPVPWVGNESDETTPTPPDFIVHAATGSDFGFPGCQWLDPAAAACAGKTAPALSFRAHSSPTGMVARGDTLYVAFFGGTTAKGPEIRAIPASGPSRRIVQSAVPLVGLGLSDGWLYFGDVTGTLYRVRV